MVLSFLPWMSIAFIYLQVIAGIALPSAAPDTKSTHLKHLTDFLPYDNWKILVLKCKKCVKQQSKNEVWPAFLWEHHSITRLVSWAFSLQEIGSFRPRQKNVRCQRLGNLWNQVFHKAAPSEPVWHQQGTAQLLWVSERRILWRQTQPHQQQGTKSKLLLETKLPPSFPCAWPLSLAGPSLARPPTLHPGISCSSTKAAAHIWAQQDSLQQTHFYCSRLFLRPRVLEMKGSLLWSWEIRDSAGVLCLGGKACELRLGWMLMLA